MTAIVDTPEEAAELELPPLLVRRPLEAYLDAHGLGSGADRGGARRRGPLERHVPDPPRRRRELVLRRPPRPPLPPSAHDVLREARLLSAVEDADVRTPQVLLACDDESVIGAPFYVMERVEGDVIDDASCPAALDDEAARARIGEELVDALVEIHAVDWEACGLGGYGKPTGYLDRQLRRFGGLWEHNKTRELPVLDELDRVAGRAQAGVGPGDDRARRLPARQHDVRPGRAGAAGRDLRLGAGDDRRPARRRRLPRRHVGAAGRPRGRAVRRSAPSRAGRASRPASS